MVTIEQHNRKILLLLSVCAPLACQIELTSELPVEIACHGTYIEKYGLTHAHTHTHTHSLTHTHTNTHTHSYSHTHTLTHSLLKHSQRVLQKPERTLVLPEAVQHQSNVTVASRHLGMILSTHHGEEVSCSIHEPQRHRGLVGVVTVDGEVDVGGEGLGVVHTQDSLVDQDGFVLEAEGHCRPLPPCS